MRYRALDAAGDMTFGSGSNSFFIDSPAAVGQAIMTRLRLFVGEWFMDTDEGTAWMSRVLGNRTGDIRDATVKARILETAAPDGTRLVSEITAYSSTVVDRRFSIKATVQTIYGSTQIQGAIA